MLDEVITKDEAALHAAFLRTSNEFYPIIARHADIGDYDVGLELLHHLKCGYSIIRGSRQF